MPITHTNRKGQTYFLCRGRTKTGKPRYYFAREPQETLAEEIPEGYEITESVNGIVSLAKARTIVLLKEEINTVKSAIQAHPEAKNYRMDIKPKEITIYERVGPDMMELAARIAADLGRSLDQTILQRMQEEERLHAQFTPIMRFILMDEEKRHFKAQRMRFSGGIDHWIDIEYNKPIAELSAALIPTLGTEEFFELF